MMESSSMHYDSEVFGDLATSEGAEQAFEMHLSVVSPSTISLGPGPM